MPSAPSGRSETVLSGRSASAAGTEAEVFARRRFGAVAGGSNDVRASASYASMRRRAVFAAEDRRGVFRGMADGVRGRRTCLTFSAMVDLLVGRHLSVAIALCQRFQS